MWQGIVGHDEVALRFRRSIERGRLASTFLFVGPAGIGKRTFALKLAQALLCQTNPPASLEPCGMCDSCVQVTAGVHPDLLLISKPPDKSFIPLSAFLGDEQRRMREGLCHDIALKPFMGGRKVALIDDADYLNEEGANALLKTLEEPPPRSVLILIGTSADKQLPTIRSRSQIVSFRPLADQVVAELLVSEGLVADAAEARRLAQFSEGSLSRAVELTDPDLWQFRQQLLGELSKQRFDSVQLARRTIEFIEAAGKEAAARRNRTRQVIRFAIDLFRQRLRIACGLAPTGDSDLCRAAGSGAAASRRSGAVGRPDRSHPGSTHARRPQRTSGRARRMLARRSGGGSGGAGARASTAVERSGVGDKFGIRKWEFGIQQAFPRSEFPLPNSEFPQPSPCTVNTSRRLPPRLRCSQR